MDHTLMKLGRAAVRRDPKRLLLGHHLLASLPDAPQECDNTQGVTAWGVMLNDSLGCCTISGLGHSSQVATLNTGGEVTPPDSLIEAGYEKYCGYVPGNPATDQGGVELDILAGITRDGFNGLKLLGYVSPDPQNIDHVKKAIAYFGSVYIGAELPLSSKNQTIWDAVDGASGAPGTWGGHCMVAPRYDIDECPFITWGENQPATWRWWTKYVDECHVLLWDAWLKKFPTATQTMILGMLQGIS
ncbi:MAG: hypothetical protein WB608_01380 [Terracidiphilus sp.]